MDERAALKTLVHAIRHRLYIGVAIIALFGIAAGAAGVLRPPSYKGTALMFVDARYNSSQGFDLALQASELLSAHFIQMATSRPVMVRACSGLYFDTAATAAYTCDPTALAPRVSAGIVKGTDWIGIDVTAPSAAEAAALANAVSRGMIDQNKADIDNLLSPTRVQLTAEQDRLAALIKTEQATIDEIQKNTPPGQAPPIASHQANLTLLESQYSAVYTKLTDLATQQSQLSGSLTIFQTALPPAKPYDPNLAIYLLVGLVAGLCVALVAVVLIDRYDDRLFDADALSTAAGTRLVVAVSARDSESNKSSEPYALARATLMAQHPHLNKVLIVAASSHDRVRPVAAGLGMAGVKAGQRVLVVDAEANTYVMHQQSGRNGSKMTIVSAPVNGGVSIAGEALADADGKYDLTIMSAPSPDTDPTAVSLARTADVAIVVATARTTRFSDVKRTTETLRLAGIKVVASILSTDSRKVAAAPPEEQEPELYEMAANQLKLPTWRGPGG